MKCLFPSARELVVMAVLALVCAVVFLYAPAQENYLALAAFPLLLTCMLLGARRGGHLDAVPARSAAVEESEPAEVQEVA